MKIQKAFISVFFLLIYSIGFAHQLVPHHQDDTVEKCFYLTESVDNHSSVENEDNCNELTCFKHSNHCDDGIYDLLHCLFNDTNHPQDDCDTELYTPVISNEYGADGFSNFKTLAILITTFTHLEFQTNSPIFNFDIQVKYLSPVFGSTSLRGPPTLL